MTSITTYYLEMTSPSAFKEKHTAKTLAIIEAEIKQFRLNKFLYQLVGSPWQWQDKLTWTDQQWQDYAENNNLRTWVAYNKGSVAGYFELEKQDQGNVQIAYFGLAPTFIGMGFGTELLNQAILSAWNWGDTQRVWVHTCSLDHASALNNYLARGFEIYNTTHAQE
jgi:GNAT superfamily N-acetyltransferase